MKTIEVNVSKKYKVMIENGIIEKSGALTVKIKSPCDAVLISDSIVYPIYGNVVKKSYESQGFRVKDFIFPSGETSKNMNTLEKLLEFMAHEKLSRKGLIIALGGGVTGDLAGFAAAVYLRGVDFVQIPTTFLSAIDSSVGGKTGVNLTVGKNLAGAFNQPIAVFCDPLCFDTLSTEVFADGLCEAVKYGCIADKKLFNSLLENNFDIEETTAICIDIKRQIVEKDELDQNERMLLNFGHTAGHAIEALSGYDISHGRAVAMGMLIAARAVNIQHAALIKDLFYKQGIDIKCPYSANQLASKAASDKKAGEGKITIVLLEEIGKAYLKKIDIAELEAFFLSGMEEY